MSHQGALDTVSVEQARAVAREFIRPYVERGDSLESLRNSSMGRHGPDFSATLGSFGYYGCWVPKSLGRDAITVVAVKNIACCHHFRLRDLYDELKTGTEQLSLFGSEAR